MGSDFLFAEPSWLSGAARVLDLTGQFDSYNESPNGDLADQRAWLNDWRNIGQSFMDAIKSITRDQTPEEPSDPSN